MTACYRSLAVFTRKPAGGWRQDRERSAKVLAQHLGPAWVAELDEGLGFDLPDPFPRQPEVPADFFQRARMAVEQAEPQLNDALLARCESIKHLLELILQHHEGRCLDGHHRIGVLDEVAEVRVFFADRRLERDRLLRDSLDFRDPFGGDAHLGLPPGPPRFTTPS